MKITFENSFNVMKTIGTEEIAEVFPSKIKIYIDDKIVPEPLAGFIINGLNGEITDLAVKATLSGQKERLTMVSEKRLEQLMAIEQAASKPKNYCRECGCASCVIIKALAGDPPR